jgi:hypothetical protein
MPGVGGAPGRAGGGTPASCQNCGDQELVCDLASGTCVHCVSDQDCGADFANPNPNAVCLPDHTCGCNADSQCAGQFEGLRCIPSLERCGCDSDADCFTSGFLTCAPNHQCGCSSNQDCVAETSAATIPRPLCDPSDGACVQCITDADCTDPNNRVCDPTIRFCLPCRTSADCAQNASGPVCGDLGALETGIGNCYCNTDTDCVGRAGGPHCVNNGSPFNKCGCATSADCSGSPDGSRCVNPYLDDWLQCGCGSTADCPTGKTCVQYTCQ